FSRVVHLRDIGAAFCTQHFLPYGGKRLNAATSVGPELAVVLRSKFALSNFLNIRAGTGPVPAKFGKSRHDIAPNRCIALRATGVVKNDRRLATRRLQIDGTHCNAHSVAALDVDLARTANRARCDLKLRSSGNIGHMNSSSSAGVSRIRFDGL